MKKKNILIFITFVVVLSIGGVYAATTIIDSKDISYDNSSSSIGASVTSISISATGEDILSGKTALVNGELVTGSLSCSASSDADIKIGTISLNSSFTLNSSYSRHYIYITVKLSSVPNVGTNTFSEYAYITTYLYKNNTVVWSSTTKVNDQCKGNTVATIKYPVEEYDSSDTYKVKTVNSSYYGSTNYDSFGCSIGSSLIFSY